MKILALDTANNTCSVALLQDGDKVSYECDTSPAKQAEVLFPLISTLLTNESLSYHDISAIAVTIGPGSFTGIRVGLAAARGLALASEIPLIGITTLEALAYDVLRESPDCHTPIMVITDARRQQLYVQLFDANCTALSEAALLRYDDIPDLLPHTPSSVTGNGVKHILPHLETTETPYSLCDYLLPDARSIAYMAHKKITASTLPASTNKEVFPLYIRKPDAKKAEGRI